MKVENNQNPSIFLATYWQFGNLLKNKSSRPFTPWETLWIRSKSYFQVEIRRNFAE
jgi:hypothetical protein